METVLDTAESQEECPPSSHNRKPDAYPDAVSTNRITGR